MYTDKPDAPENVRIPSEDIKDDSFIVQWDAVTDVFPITYTVRWYGVDIDNTATTTKLRYTVTGLTSNTSYSVTVVAINACCGTGPVSVVVMVTTMSSNVIIATMMSSDTVMPTVSIPSPNDGAGMDVYSNIWFALLSQAMALGWCMLGCLN